MTSRIISLTVASLFLASSVWADGETRPTTAAEAGFMRTVYAAFQKAAPRSGPEGWEEGERSGGEVTDRVFKGVERAPMRLEYRLKWLNTASNEAVQQKRDEIVLNPDSAPAAPDVALQRRYEELAAKIGAAAEKGNMKEVTRLQKEMEKVGNRMMSPSVDAENRLKDKNRAIAGRDLYVKLIFEINVPWISSGPDAKGPVKLPPIAGNAAYRLNSESYFENHAEWVEGTSCVVLGAWKSATMDTEKGLVASHVKKAPHTKVQSVNVCAEGAPDRARAVLTAIQWDALKSLLAR